MYRSEQMTTAASCSNCKGVSTVVKVLTRWGNVCAQTEGFWCLNCNSKWIVRKKPDSVQHWRKWQ